MDGCFLFVVGAPAPWKSVMAPLFIFGKPAIKVVKLKEMEEDKQPEVLSARKMEEVAAIVVEV